MSVTWVHSRGASRTQGPQPPSTLLPKVLQVRQYPVAPLENTVGYSRNIRLVPRQ